MALVISFPIMGMLGVWIQQRQGFWKVEALVLLFTFLGVCCADVYFRVQRTKNGDWRNVVWYDMAKAKAEHEPVRFIFVGSSAMAAAIDPDAFSGRLAERNVLHGLTLNMGQGYSTLKQHYLGLRNLFWKVPQNLTGCVVVVEMKSGTLNAEARTSPWAFQEAPGFLAPVLTEQDVPDLLLSSDPPLRKLICLWQFALPDYPLERISTLIVSRDRLRKWYLDKAREALISALTTLPNSVAAVDLTTAGGIRNSRYSVEWARRLAFETAAAAMLIKKSNPPSAYARNEDIVKLIKSFGGDIVFLSLPMSPLFEKAAATEVGRENQRVSMELVHQWGSRVVQVQFPTSEYDFPDLWHLSGTRAREFSQRVADEFVKELFASENVKH